MQIGELFISLGINADTAKVKEFTDSLSNTAMKAVGIIAALAGVSVAITDMYNETMKAAIGFQKFGNMTGLSAQELQRWQIAGQMANVSAETVASSIAGLQDRMMQLRLTGQGFAPFMYMGVNPSGNAFQVLEQLHQRMKEIPASMRSFAVSQLSQMGLSPDMVNVLMLTDAKFKEFNKTLQLTFSRENQAHMLEFQEKMVQLRLEFMNFYRNAIAGLEPAALTLLNFFSGLKQELAWAKDGLIALGAVMAVIFREQVAAAGLRTGAFLMSLATNPVAQFIAALAALLLILDDLYQYFHGGKSVFGYVMAELPKIAQALKTAFTGVFDSIFGAGAMDRFDALLTKIERVFTALKSFQAADSMLGTAAGITANATSGGLLDLFKPPSSGMFGGGIPGMAPAMAFAGSGAGNSVGKIEINVHAAGEAMNPAHIASEVERVIVRIFDRTNHQIDNQGH